MLCIWWLWLAAGCSSESVTTPYGLSLQWSIRAPAVTFTLKMPAGMAREYDYWGVGWKAGSSEPDMKQAEVWIVTKAGQFLSYLSRDNEAPQDGSRSSAVMASFRSGGDYYEAVVVRELQTDSLNDIQMVEGGSYTLIYAYGYVSDTAFTPHAAEDSGTVAVVLTSSPPHNPTYPEYPESTSGSDLPESGFETTNTLPPDTSASITVALLAVVLVAMVLL